MTKLWGAILLIILLYTPARAGSVDPCGHCAGKLLEPIHVHLVSGDQSASWIFTDAGQSERDRYHKQFCPSCKLAQYTMTDASGFVAAIEEAAANCQQIKLLTVVSHGGAGKVSIGADTDHMDSFGSQTVIKSLNPELSCAIAPDATLYFDGCNIARGCRGESFVTLLAGRLLPKGGTIEACYVKGRVVPLPLVGGDTICVQPHTLHVDPGLKNPRWTEGPAPKTGGECRQNMERDVAMLQRLIYEKGDCNDIGGAEYAITVMKQAMLLEDELGVNRTQFGELQSTEAAKLQDAYARLDSWINPLRRASKCARPKTDCPTCEATTGPTWGDKLRALWDKI